MAYPKKKPLLSEIIKVDSGIFTKMSHTKLVKALLFRNEVLKLYTKILDTIIKFLLNSKKTEKPLLAHFSFYQF